MSDSRRDFLMRFAATALAASGAGCETAQAPEMEEFLKKKPAPRVVYGPPPRSDGDVSHFNSTVGNEVRFDTGSRVLRPDARAILDRQVEWLLKFPAHAIAIEGHCDERGTREYNLALGEARAVAVKDYMVAKGIPADRIETRSFGKERPVDLGHDEASWARNRRAVTVLSAN